MKRLYLLLPAHARPSPAHSGPKRFSLTVPALFEYCFGIPQEGSPRRQNAAFLSLCAQLISWMSGGTGIRGRLRIYSERLRVRVPPHPPPVPLSPSRPVAPLPTRAALRASSRPPSPRTPARTPSPCAHLVWLGGRARCPHRAAAPSARCAALHPAPSPPPSCPVARAPWVRSRCGRARCPHRAAAPSARCAAWRPAPLPPPRVPLPVPRGCGPVAVGRDVPIAPPRHRRGARQGK